VFFAKSTRNAFFLILKASKYFPGSWKMYYRALAKEDIVLFLSPLLALATTIVRRLNKYNVIYHY